MCASCRDLLISGRTDVLRGGLEAVVRATAWYYYGGENRWWVVKNRCNILVKVSISEHAWFVINMSSAIFSETIHSQSILYSVPVSSGHLLGSFLDR
jgi:hypothetical protein